MASTRFTAAHRRLRPVSSHRPDWKYGCDGDGECAFDRPGNHTIHMLRRNVGIKVLLFITKIYGLTKGQLLADFGTQQESEIYAFWIVGPAVQSRFAGHRIRGYVRGPLR